mmetsp:Transcript_42223/g.112699  ORF Transcript_42223/g.112699 Transcript_42223/m.112699 type:complete len:154 (+) Transcript_42223:883-1344(+)
MLTRSGLGLGLGTRWWPPIDWRMLTRSLLTTHHAPRTTHYALRTRHVSSPYWRMLTTPYWRMLTTHYSRILTTAGGARQCLEIATDYVKEREQFGKPLSHLQSVQFKLADMATELHASRLLLRHAARSSYIVNRAIYILLLRHAARSVSQSVK